jgi:hypothetical protein
MNFEDGRLADTSNPRIERSWGPLFVGTVALPSSMLVRTDSPVDARIALLLALLHAVEGRASRRGLNFQRPIDTVRYGADDVSARLSDVILAMLHVHEEEIIWTADPPTSGNVLVQIAQRWVTERLEDKPGSKTFDPDQFSLEALAQVVNTALQLSDGPSDLHYLAGVLALTGKKANPAKAAALVESGWKIDRMTRFRGSVYLAQVVAQHLETASGESELAREAATAKAALYGDLTMRLDAEEAPRWLLECIKESKIHKDLSILRMALDKKWDTGLEDLFRRSISPGIEHLWRLVGLEAQLSLPCAPTSNPPAEQAPTVTAAVGSASR